MVQMMTRRDFVRATAVFAAQAGVARPSDPAMASPGDDPYPPAASAVEWRNKQPEMRYRRLGRTGLMIAEIVCGGDPVAPDNNRHVEIAIDLGLNYLDTAPA